MAEPNFSILGDDTGDDLPRTFRREKEARAREARERAAQERAAAPVLPMGSPSPEARSDLRSDVRADVKNAASPQLGQAADVRPAKSAPGDVGMAATVKRFDVPFAHLVTFFLKCVVAAIPALILLGGILWAIGAVSSMLFPNLVKLKILIGLGT